MYQTTIADPQPAVAGDMAIASPDGIAPTDDDDAPTAVDVPTGAAGLAAGLSV